MATKLNVPGAPLTTAAPPLVSPGRLFIDGQWGNAQLGGSFIVRNPATEDELTRAADASRVDLDAAVMAAWAAFHRGPWQKMDGRERGQLLNRAAELILQRAETLAMRETLDTGKPIRYTRAIDVPLAAELFAYYGGLATQMEDELRVAGTPMLHFVLREPLGVVGILSAAHDPLVSAAAKLAPALAAGNTVVHRPAALTPLSALLLADILAEAGLPEGVYNLVTGEGHTLDAALAQHAGVDKLLFSGDAEGGRQILRDAAESLKRVSLDLGRRHTGVLFADAEMEPALRNAFYGVCYSKGEVGSAGTRLLVERPIYDAVVARLQDLLHGWRPGDPMDAATLLGPVGSEAQLDALQRVVRLGLDEGATLAAGGTSRVSPRADGRGYYFAPTLFTRVGPAMRLAREEVVGPLLTLVPFNGLDELLGMAAEGLLGQVTSLHTRDLGRGYRVARALRTGTVWINPYREPGATFPYSAPKLSVYGREYGREVVERLLRRKTVWMEMG